MSYTNKKIIWEQCLSHTVKPVGDVYLFDDNEDLLASINLELLTVEGPDSANAYSESIMDEYNDTFRPLSFEILARKQPHEEVLKTPDGKEILTKSYFYVDPKVEPRALEIKYLDKLDGETVMQKYIMCDSQNKPKMVRYITI